MLASSTIGTRAFQDCSPDGNSMFIWLVVPRNVGDRNLFRRERIALNGIPASNIPIATAETLREILAPIR
jgi:hypothetical protein